MAESSRYTGHGSSSEQVRPKDATSPGSQILSILRASCAGSTVEITQKIVSSFTEAPYYNKGMAVPLLPGSVEQIGRRPFAFYPAIVGIEHNAWILRRITWSGVEVANRKTSQEVFIPRRFLGEVSLIGEPYLIVGLIKELEHKEGAVIPHQRRVIEMPRAVNQGIPARPFTHAAPAPVVGIRSEVGAQSRTGRRLLTWIA